MRHLRLLFSLPAFFCLTFLACGPDCTSVCDKIYNECGYDTPGYNYGTCVKDCEEDLDSACGDEQEREDWLSCMEDASCEEIGEGAC